MSYLAYLLSNCHLILLLFIDVCLTLPCGVNAKCETADGEYSCTCPENMEGDPKMKCEGIHIYSFGLTSKRLQYIIFQQIQLR